MDTGDSVNQGSLRGINGDYEVKIDEDPFKKWGGQGGRLGQEEGGGDKLF